jgi:hypothetical protein
MSIISPICGTKRSRYKKKISGNFPIFYKGFAITYKRGKWVTDDTSGVQFKNEDLDIVKAFIDIFLEEFPKRK